MNFCDATIWTIARLNQRTGQVSGNTPRVSSSAASNSWVLSCTVRRTVVSVVVVVFQRLANGSWTVRMNGGAFGRSARRLPHGRFKIVKAGWAASATRCAGVIRRGVLPWRWDEAPV